jgi:hypothetical protein
MRLHGVGNSEGSYDSDDKEVVVEEGSSTILPKQRKKVAGMQLSRAIVGHGRGRGAEWKFSWLRKQLALGRCSTIYATTPLGYATVHASTSLGNAWAT